MKVLHVIDSLIIGGAEVLVTELCAVSRRAGREVELYALRGGGPLEEEARKAGIVVHVGSAGSVYSPLHVLRLARFMKSRQFDIVHMHLYPAQLWVCLASWLIGGKTPLVTTEHSTSNRRRTATYRWLDRWMYRQFSAIAAISEATRDALLAHVGPGIPVVTVVPNGVDARHFEPSLRPRGEPKTTPVILSIGSLTPVKDQATLIRAISKVDGVKLMLAGEGPQRTELEMLTSALQVESRVTFLGIRRDIPELIARADLYVQASRWEGFCLAVVEAMCGGLPCIVARNSGLQEIVGQAGLYFEPGNADELAAAIKVLCRDSHQREALANRGIDQAKKFTLQACSDAYEDFYRHTVGRDSPVVRNDKQTAAL